MKVLRLIYRQLTLAQIIFWEKITDGPDEPDAPENGLDAPEAPDAPENGSCIQKFSSLYEICENM